MTSLSFTVLEIIECSLDKCKYPLMNFNCVFLINPIIRLLNIKEISLAIDLFVQKKISMLAYSLSQSVDV